MKKYFTVVFLLSIFLLINCKQKKSNDRKNKLNKNKTRIIYKWHEAAGMSCFLLQGKIRCWFARCIKIKENMYSVRIKPDPFKENPMLKFTLQNLATGVKSAWKNDVNYTDEKGNIYTNFDSPAMQILKITEKRTNSVKAKFNFKIRNSSGKWLYFTQGYFKAKIR